tara:strand:- start:48 stop:1214 length:1167 start_codon:yes stop_codon:yes gene_type:complete
MNSIIKNFPVVVHQLFFLFAQLLILQLYGIGYSGSLAYIGVISTFLAVLINLRWDIEIMISNDQALYKSLLDASLTIILMTAIIFLLNLITGSILPIHIILSGIAIAIHELLVSILFVQRKIYIYSLYRSIPAIALIFFALIGYEPEIIWPASFMLSVFFLLIYFRNLFKKAISVMSFNIVRKINLTSKINAAITASTFSFFSASFVIVINLYYGDDYVGLWSNTIRIFNSMIIFLLAAFLPFLLNIIREEEFNSEKIKKFFYLWILFLPLIIFSLIVVSNFGLHIFSIFKSFNLEITNMDLSYIFLIGVSISFIGSSQGLYQAMNKSIILLSIIILMALIGFVIIYKNIYSFSGLLEIFLILILFLIFIILAHLIYSIIFKNYKLHD